jgi:integrase
LRSHRERQGRIGFDRIAADQLVFQTKNGKSPRRRNTHRAIQVQAVKLGLEGVGAHTLRHSCAGLLRSMNFSNEEIAPILRHSNSRTTAIMYGGLDEDTLSQIKSRAAEALS